MNKILVSASDSGYFKYLQDLVSSIIACNEHTSIDLGILDLGLSETEIAWLKNYTHRIVKPECSLPVPADKRNSALTLSVTERLFLPEHFPGYDIYLFMDSDTWIQDWTGINYYLTAAQHGYLAVTPQLNRSYIGAETMRHQWRYDNFKLGYGEQAARELYLRTHMNAGVFALPANAPHWGKWRERFLEAIERSGGSMLVEQIALNYMLYKDGMHFCPLPASCNWVCHLAAPLWNSKQGRFVEPVFPHESIHVMHLTGTTKIDQLRYPGAAALKKPA